ncbi:hypothetical protein MMC21_005313 [Puttea exsequens]|nr:hypothetical protein [Puttea exsequens]
MDDKTATMGTSNLPHTSSLINLSLITARYIGAVPPYEANPSQGMQHVNAQTPGQPMVQHEYAHTSNLLKHYFVLVLQTITMTDGNLCNQQHLPNSHLAHAHRPKLPTPNLSSGPSPTTTTAANTPTAKPPNGITWAAGKAGLLRCWRPAGAPAATAAGADAADSTYRLAAHARPDSIPNRRAAGQPPRPGGAGRLPDLPRSGVDKDGVPFG